MRLNHEAVWYSGLTLNQYGVALPYYLCTVCGFVALS